MCSQSRRVEDSAELESIENSIELGSVENIVELSSVDAGHNMVKEQSSSTARTDDDEGATEAIIYNPNNVERTANMNREPTRKYELASPEFG